MSKDVSQEGIGTFREPKMFSMRSPGCVREGEALQEALKVSRSQVILGLPCHVRSLNFILRLMLYYWKDLHKGLRRPDLWFRNITLTSMWISEWGWGRKRRGMGLYCGAMVPWVP